MKSFNVPGINIQTPWAELILSGKKTIETRFYRLPKKHTGKPLAIIETPGKRGKFKARIIGFVVFDSSFEYQTKRQFTHDSSQHLVSANDDFYWKSGKKKWGWKIASAFRLTTSIPAPSKRGIVFCTRCIVPTKLLLNADSKLFDCSK